MSVKQQNSHHLKKKVSDIITLLTEAKTLADQLPDIDPAIQTSLVFMSKAAIDLNYQVHDFAAASENADEIDTESSS
tara:strand:+ start:1836 stop:2066 length:231 start_codon:yes stop_codon:yes gene_type:complete